jgi:hypothetical protein
MIMQFDIVHALYTIWQNSRIVCYICCSHMPITSDSRSLLSRSSMFIDGNGGTFEIDLEDIRASKADPLGQFIFTRTMRRWLPSSAQRHAYTCMRNFFYLCIPTSNDMKFVFCAARFSAKLIDGINQSEARRRALMLFCFVYLNANARVRH